MPSSNGHPTSRMTDKPAGCTTYRQDLRVSCLKSSMPCLLVGNLSPVRSAQAPSNLPGSHFYGSRIADRLRDPSPHSQPHLRGREKKHLIESLVIFRQLHEYTSERTFKLFDIIWWVDLLHM